MSTTYKKISELTKKTSNLVDADYLTGVDTSNNQNANFTLSALKSYFQTKLESIFAKIASPTLTGTPKAPTAADRNNTTQIATTAFVQKELAYQAENANTVSKDGDIMSGTLKVSTSDTAAQVIAEESTSTASCMLTANASGQAGIYDSGNGKWIIATDSNGEVCLSNTLVALTNSTTQKIYPQRTGWEPDYTNIPNLGQYNLIYVRVAVQGSVIVLTFPRFDNMTVLTQYFDDVAYVGSTASYARLRVDIDWANNRVGTSLINGTLSNQDCYIYGIWGTNKVI